MVGMLLKLTTLMFGIRSFVRPMALLALGAVLLAFLFIDSIDSVDSASSQGTTYPILDATYWYAAARHIGESRLGTVGTINKNPQSSRAELQPVCSGGSVGCILRFDYAFGDSADPEEFAGAFFTFGRIAITPVNQDGTPAPDIDLHRDHTLDLTDLMSNSEDDAISIESLKLVLHPNGQNQILNLRIEMEDQNRDKMFTRVPFDSGGTSPLTLNVPLSQFNGSIDLTAVKLVAIVIEERHIVDGVSNPPDGGLDIKFLGLVDEDGPQFEAHHIAGLSDTNMVREVAKRDFESLLRLTDRQTGASLDRTLFRDLLHWGATGWLLASLPAAVDQGWITGDEARELGLKTLRFLDDDSLWGDDPVGKVGNSRGIMYRFGGIDPSGLNGRLTGTRKIDIGDINAVEASVIDTALFQFGSATFAAGFATTDPRDLEIQDRVKNILSRTIWDELVDPKTGQLMLGWKPEIDDNPPGFFTVPTPFGGFWASRGSGGEAPLTLDFWTDEGAMAAILASGSETHPASPET